MLTLTNNLGLVCRLAKVESTLKESNFSDNLEEFQVRCIYNTSSFSHLHNVIFETTKVKIFLFFDNYIENVAILFYSYSWSGVRVCHQSTNQTISVVSVVSRMIDFSWFMQINACIIDEPLVCRKIDTYFLVAEYKYLHSNNQIFGNRVCYRIF